MLTGPQLRHLAEQGYLLVPDVLDDDDLAPVVAEFEAALDASAADAVARGNVTSALAELPFGERYTALVREDPGVFYRLGISLPLDYESLDPDLVICHTGPAFFGLLSNPKLLDVVESVIGGEISLNPVLQTRLKPPQALLQGAAAEYSNLGTTTWHQDYGAVMDEAADTEMLTVWVAMTDATEEMGCLVVMPGSHLAGTLTLHCPGRSNPAENHIPQALIDRHGRPPEPLPCRRGTIVLLTRFTEHASLPNRSDRLRWSFDLRYQPTGQPTGRPAFPTFALRSRSGQPVATAADYARGWTEARQRIVGGEWSGPLYAQSRWLANRDHPLCA